MNLIVNNHESYETRQTCVQLWLSEKSSKQIEIAVVGTPSINSFFKIQDSGADNSVAVAAVENVDTVEEVNFQFAPKHC